MTDAIKNQAIRMIEEKDLTHWSDAHDKVVLAALRAQPARVPVALSRDDTEHGVYYYRADEVDALLRAQPANSLKTAIRLVLDATPEQLPMAIDALRDLAIGEAME